MQFTFGDRLRRLRFEKHLKQDDCADALGISIHTYRKYEQTSHYPNAETLMSLASFFGVSVGYLFGETAPKDDADREMLDLLHRLTPEQRVMIQRMVRSLIDE